MHVKDPVVHVRVQWSTETRIYPEHALVGLGSTALVAAVSLTQVRWHEFPERDFFFLRSSIAYVTVFNSSAIWAATFRLRRYKCMLVIFMFP